MVHSHLHSPAESRQDLPSHERREQHLWPKRHIHVLEEGDLDLIRLREQAVEGSDAPEGCRCADRVHGDVSATEITPVERE